MTQDPHAHDEIVNGCLQRIDELIRDMHALNQSKRWVRLAAYCQMVRANLNAVESMCEQLTERDKRTLRSDPTGHRPPPD